MTVERVRLGELLELSRSPVALDDAGSYERIGIYSWGKGLFRRDAVRAHEMGSLRYFSVPESALVVSNIQAWEGALAISSPDDARCVASNRFLSYVPTGHDRVDIRYVLQYLLSEEGLVAVRGASPGTQVRNRTLSRRAFEAISIPLPSAGEQRCIAARLERLARLVPAVSGHSLTVDALQVVGERRPWDTPLSALLELDVDEFDVVGEATYSRAGVLSAGRGLFSQGTLAGHETKYRKLRRVRAGQVVLSRLTAFIGGVALAASEFDGFVVSQEYPTFSLRSGVPPAYVKSLMASPEMVRRLQAVSTGVGNTRQRVSADAFLGLEVPSMTPAEQQRVAHLHVRVARHAQLVARRQQLAQALLPAARNEVFSRLR